MWAPYSQKKSPLSFLPSFLVSFPLSISDHFILPCSSSHHSLLFLFPRPFPRMTSHHMLPFALGLSSSLFLPCHPSLFPAHSFTSLSVHSLPFCPSIFPHSFESLSSLFPLPPSSDPSVSLTLSLLFLFFSRLSWQ